MSVLVIGAANVDIGGRSGEVFRPHDSNPGRVTSSLGGVGFNIARNLCLLGVDTAMLTVLGDDSFAAEIRREAARIGLDMQCCPTLSGERTGTYLYLLDEQGDMVAALNDMRIYERMTPTFLRDNLAAVDRAELVVLDANLPRESIEYLCANCTAPIVCDPVSAVKAEKLRRVLGKLTVLKPNAVEAEALTGIAVTDGESLRRAAKKLLASGLRQVYISCGINGLYAEARAGEACHVPCPPIEVVNATGGGDALTAALAACFLRGGSLTETARSAIAAGAFACTAETTVHPQMSWENIEKLSVKSEKRKEK